MYIPIDIHLYIYIYIYIYRRHIEHEKAEDTTSSVSTR